MHASNEFLNPDCVLVSLAKQGKAGSRQDEHFTA